MSNVVVTSGAKYLDIDGYASCIAYAILLRANGVSAKAVTTAPLNESVPEFIKNIDLAFDDYVPVEGDKFVLLDVSDPSMFDGFVRMSDVVEVIDHHVGFEEFWEEKKSRGEVDKVDIEFIGAICTNIYEKFFVSGKTGLLTEGLCKLLVAGILNNTLNLKASVTTERDVAAYKALCNLAKLSADWAKEYFDACEEEILRDLKSAIINDTKITKAVKDLPDAFGQLAVYDKNKILSQIDLTREAFAGHDTWMMNIISLKDGRSYIFAEPEEARKSLEDLFELKFENSLLVLDEFLLRKEIIKKALKK